MHVLLVPAELIDRHNQLSTNTLRRCVCALEEWRTGAYDVLLLCGGLFLAPERQSLPASLLMRDWFVQQGVPAECILTEARSLDTYQNIAFGIEMLNKTGKNWNITVLTQYQHALRFWITFLLAHHIRVNTRPIRQPAMHVKDWLVEWLVLIPYHLVDWHGCLWLAVHNRRQRQKAANKD